MLGFLLIGLVAAGAYAFPFGGKDGMRRGNDEIRSAFEAGDYEAYLAALGDTKKAMTEDRFNDMVDRFLERSKDQSAMQAKRQQIEDALDNADFDAWQEAVGSDDHPCKMSEAITEENFDTFVKLHQAREDRDIETAKKLAEDLGMNPGGELRFGMMSKFGGFHKHNGMHNGSE